MQDLYVETTLRGSHNIPPVNVSELPQNYKLCLRLFSPVISNQSTRYSL